MFKCQGNESVVVYLERTNYQIAVLRKGFDCTGFLDIEEMFSIYLFKTITSHLRPNGRAGVSFVVSLKRHVDSV